MTYPTPARIAAATKAMRDESALWSDQSDRLANAINMVNTLRVTGVGRTIIFDAFVDPYNEAIHTFFHLLVGGKYATKALGEKLAALAAAYEEDEAANLHAQRRLY